MRWCSRVSNPQVSPTVPMRSRPESRNPASTLLKSLSTSSARTARPESASACIVASCEKSGARRRASASTPAAAAPAWSRSACCAERSYSCRSRRISLSRSRRSSSSAAARAPGSRARRSPLPNKATHAVRIRAIQSVVCASIPISPSIYHTKHSQWTFGHRSRSRPHEAQAQAAAAAARVVPATVRGAEEARVAVPPAAAAKHPARASLRLPRGFLRRTRVIVLVVPVRTPLPHVPALVVRSPTAYPLRIPVHRTGLVAPLVLVVAALRLVPVLSPRIREPQRPPARTLPLRLARQRTPRPLRIRQAVAPRNVCHGMIRQALLAVARIARRTAPCRLHKPQVLRIRHRIHPDPVTRQLYPVTWTFIHIPLALGRSHLELPSRHMHQQRTVLRVYRQRVLDSETAPLYLSQHAGPRVSHVSDSRHCAVETRRGAP